MPASVVVDFMRSSTRSKKMKWIGLNSNMPVRPFLALNAAQGPTGWRRSGLGRALVLKREGRDFDLPWTLVVATQVKGAGDPSGKKMGWCLSYLAKEQEAGTVSKCRVLDSSIVAAS
ncbi:hypothetical protein BM1_02241 [Bipolaris maydis]|nr:hypothetical protein BM1_02241 [Bipolaris maydis]